MCSPYINKSEKKLKLTLKIQQLCQVVMNAATHCTAWGWFGWSVIYFMFFFSLIREQKLRVEGSGEKSLRWLKWMHLQTTVLPTLSSVAASCLSVFCLQRKTRAAFRGDWEKGERRGEKGLYKMSFQIHSWLNRRFRKDTQLANKQRLHRWELRVTGNLAAKVKNNGHYEARVSVWQFTPRCWQSTLWQSLTIQPNLQTVLQTYQLTQQHYF